MRGRATRIRSGGGITRLTLGLMVFGALAATTVHAACGDGILEPGEQCDPGPTGALACCLPNCTIARAGTECRPAAGECDVAEACDGVAAACPSNVFKPAQECRPAAGPCDLAEQCSGVGPACPVDGLSSPDTTCRPAGTPCDVPELCTGASLVCPDDTGEPDRDTDGVCDRQDRCPLVADPQQPDGDGDGVGDACDPCTDVAGGEMSQPRLGLSRLSAPGDDDRLRIKALVDVPSDPKIDPLEKGLRLVLAGPLGVVLDAVLEPRAFDSESRAGWRADGEHRWSYKNAGTEVPRVAGITSVGLRQDENDPGRLRVVVLGRGGDMQRALGQTALTLSVILDAPLAATGQCAETRFVTVGDTADCRLLNTGRRLDCRKKN